MNQAGSLASFSNYGVKSVSLAAPGVNILSTVPGGYAYMSGTSMATPYVSGVVALVAGLHPSDTAAQLVQQVLSTTKPLAGLAGKTATGGIVDAARAVGLGRPGLNKCAAGPLRRRGADSVHRPECVDIPSPRTTPPRSSPAAPSPGRFPPPADFGKPGGHRAPAAAVSCRLAELLGVVGFTLAVVGDPHSDLGEIGIEDVRDGPASSSRRSSPSWRRDS